MTTTEDSLIDYLTEAKTDIDTGLTAKKFFERAFDKKTENNFFYFSMERHKPILGSEYIKGQPLAAFKTTTERYEFNPSTKNIKIIQTSKPNFQIYDISSLAENNLVEDDFEFNGPDEHGKYTFTAFTSGIFEVVNSPEEAIDIVLGTEDEDFYLEKYSYDLDGAPNEFKTEAMKSLIKAIAKKLAERIEEAWEECNS